MNKIVEQRMLANWTSRPPGTKASMAKQSGFTLIEIAIVLVIIGLLLGGVLKGQELINTARVRALNNTVDGVTAAWFRFQDRYRAFPGDYISADVNLPGAQTSGNGNGLVDSDIERGNVWRHLQAAGSISGSFQGNIVAVDAYNCSAINCPGNGFGFGMNISFASESTGAGIANANELITGSGIPVEVLAEMDRKIDDGLANSGAMRLGNGGAGWDATAAAACISGDNYQLQTPSSNCAAVFRNF